MRLTWTKYKEQMLKLDVSMKSKVTENTNNCELFDLMKIQGQILYCILLVS